MGAPLCLCRRVDVARAFHMVKRQKFFIAVSASVCISLALLAWWITREGHFNSVRAFREVSRLCASSSSWLHTLKGTDSAVDQVRQAELRNGLPESCEIEAFSCSFLRSFPCYAAIKVRRNGEWRTERLVLFKESMISFSSEGLQ